MADKKLLFTPVLNVEFAPHDHKIIRIFDGHPNTEYIIEMPFLFSFPAEPSSNLSMWALTIVTCDGTKGFTAEEQTFINNLVLVENTVKVYMETEMVKSKLPAVIKKMDILEKRLSNNVPVLKMGLETKSWEILNGVYRLKRQIAPKKSCIIKGKICVYGVYISPIETKLILHVKSLSIINYLPILDKFLKIKNDQVVMSASELQTLPPIVKNQIDAIKLYNTTWHDIIAKQKLLTM